MFLLGFQTLQ